MSFKEDLEQKCIKSVKLAFDFFEGINFSSTKGVIEKQLIRSLSSVGANLIEGSGSVSRKEWLNYMNISRKSALESEYWVKILKELNFGNKAKLDLLEESIRELSKIFTSLIKNAKKK